ncbi:tRNA guanosine(34) transglycosylase Tgt [Candidatus Azambacteria bacterium]|nr:tRNA guanosine(34) transglycosylase Tgt [Candidatus Azambacteria bacterium]
MIEFNVLKKSKISGARVGILKTSHGEIETPTFVPVATQAAVKTLDSFEVAKTGSQILMANTFHLHLKPGDKIVKANGGLHEFMNWPKPLMTDSGGFQVFSLGFGTDFGTGKILKSSSKKTQPNIIETNAQPKSLRITDQGVYFRSPIDGQQLFIGPKESIKIQENLGADIILAFDECPPPMASYEYLKKSLVKTHNWALDCLKAKKSNQAIYGIIQGGFHKDLRKESAQFIGALPFDGFGIGGEFGGDKKKMADMIAWTLNYLPRLKPVHLLGIGHPDDLELIIKAGVDSFDCIIPTHYARRGIAFVEKGQLDLTNPKFLKDQLPIDQKCLCFTCQTYRRSYLCHLFRAKEISALKLLSSHNLYFFNDKVAKIREKIRNGKF